MIALPRSLARRFRAVLRRCGPTGRRADLPPSVLLRAGEQGLCLEAACPDAAVRLEHPGKHPEGVLAFPADALALFEGRTDEPVTLEQKSFGQGLATWDEGGSPARKDFPTLAVEGLPAFPEVPERLRKLDAAFLRALDDACGATARDSGRYALERVLLRGKGGEVVATDARHLLVQSGFDLPWPGDALVPRLGVWGMKELPQDGSVGVGRTEGNVFVRAGPWTFALGCGGDARFPAYDQIVPRASTRTSVLRLGTEDIDVLLRELRGPAAEREATATLELGPDIAMHVRPAAKEEAAELRLVGSRWSGPPLRVAYNPRYLLNALRLGFTEVEIRSPSVPLCCRDATRVYLWMPLSDESATTTPARPAQSAAAEQPVPSEPVKETPMPPNSADNGRHAGNGNADLPPGPPGPAPLDPLAEAEEIRALLAEAQSRLGRLIAALKQHRRQARAVAAAMAQLKNLPLGR